MATAVSTPCVIRRRAFRAHQIRLSAPAGVFANRLDGTCDGDELEFITHCVVRCETQEQARALRQAIDRGALDGLLVIPGEPHPPAAA